MAKYVIELSEDAKQLINDFLSVRHYGSLNELQYVLRQMQPLSHLDLQTEMYKIWADAATNKPAAVTEKSFEERYKELNSTKSILVNKVISWLYKNGFKPIDNYNAYTATYTNDGDIMHISNYDVENNPMYVVHLVTHYLHNCTFFQNWDDDDDDLLPKKVNNQNVLTTGTGISSSNWAPVPPDGRIKHPWVDNYGYEPYKSTCTHEWKTYTGLNETFEYCSKCDEKKGKQ